MNSRDKQKDDICSRLNAIWRVGASRTTFIELLQGAARYHECKLEDLTDDQVEAWATREIQHIHDVCAGSVLNG